MDTIVRSNTGITDNSQRVNEDIVSVPNSQASSLNDSATSHHDSQPDLSSIATSQTSVVDPCLLSHDERSLSSKAEKSAHVGSEYRSAAGPDGLPGKGVPSSKPSMTEVSVTCTTSNHSQALHGQKRMSNGHLKSPSIESPISPAEVTVRGFHGRRLSNVSSGSQVGELAAQLRTRLSYAMVKVENGWQDRTIDEVENLASRQSSMAPPTPQPHQIQGSTSRRNVGPHHKRTESAQFSERSTVPLSETLIAHHDSAVSSQKGHSATLGQALLYPKPQSPRTVQQRPNASRNGPTYNGSYASSRIPKLAPAFDVSDARRTAQPNPPRLNTNNISNLSSLSATSTLSSNSNLPSTPPPRHSSLAKSPSTTTPMEQDAIETLLTMSSPGNSQHGPMYGHLPGSPLRNHFRPPERRVGFVPESRPRVFQTPPEPPSRVRLRTDEDVDRYLDQMARDDESSDE